MAVDFGAGRRQINVYRGRATSNVVPDSAVEPKKQNTSAEYPL
jgi:hypothetical protein